MATGVRCSEASQKGVWDFWQGHCLKLLLLFNSTVIPGRKQDLRAINTSPWLDPTPTVCQLLTTVALTRFPVLGGGMPQKALHASVQKEQLKAKSLGATKKPRERAKKQALW